MEYQYLKSELDWIDVIPSHWRKDKIFRVADLVTSGGTPQSGNEAYYDGDIYWIQSGDLNDSYITETEKKITNEGLSNSSAKLFPSNTLLIAMYGASIGKLGIQTMEAATNQACCAIIAAKKIEVKFLYYFFWAMREKLISDAYGGGQPNISQSVIKQTYFYYPTNLNEQKEIIQYLDKVCADIDTVLRLKAGKIKADENDSDSEINILRQYRKSLVHEVITGKKQVFGLTKEK
jgi:type I restriction enzyme S subunit